MGRKVLPQHRRNPAHNWRGARRKDGTFKKSRRSKYSANGREEDGHWFPSKAEADRYLQLKEMLLDGKIEDLELQPSYPMYVNNILVATYRADFRYKKILNGMARKRIVEDVKGMHTKEYLLKMRLMKAVHPDVVVTEIHLGKLGNVQHLRFLTADEIGPSTWKEKINAKASVP